MPDQRVLTDQHQMCRVVNMNITECANESHTWDEFDGNCITCADRDHYGEGAR